MNELAAVRCARCGGAIRAVPGRPLPACLFCGVDASELLPFDPPEAIEHPTEALPFRVEAATAQEAFRRFARSSPWYPGDLRDARLELRRLLIPAWAWSGQIETHWTALVTGGTRSGKAPLAGVETVEFQQVLVPSSATLQLSELTALGSYDESELVSWSAESSTDPHELAELTRSAAKQRAVSEMERRHRISLKQRHHALRLKTSTLAGELSGRPVLVPIWVGAYRYGEQVHRILVNGQSGRLHGTAPVSWLRVAAAAGSGLLLLVGAFLLIAWVSG